MARRRALHVGPQGGRRQQRLGPDGVAGAREHVPRDAGRVAPGGIWHTRAIRTTLDIDDHLMTALLARLPGRSKTEAIEFAISTFVANDAVDRLKALAGTLDIDDLSIELRRRDRTT